jgi:cell wall-associated NlpC family hydrolase
MRTLALLALPLLTGLAPSTVHAEPALPAAAARAAPAARFDVTQLPVWVPPPAPAAPPEAESYAPQAEVPEDTLPARSVRAQVAEAGEAFVFALAAEVFLPPDSEVALTAGKPAAQVRAATFQGRPGPVIARRAVKLVGVRNLKRVVRHVPDDCSGLARASYESAGIDLVSGGFRPGENAVSAIWRLARRAGALHRKTPKAGDLVFFRETYDRNRDGRRNDGLTHIGVVESVAPDGTVTFIHRASRGVTRSKLNPRQPRTFRTPRGETLNDYLRPKSKRLRAYLTGELFVGYAAADKLR